MIHIHKICLFKTKEKLNSMQKNLIGKYQKIQIQKDNMAVSHSGIPALNFSICSIYLERM